MAITGRPTKYTEEIAHKICSLIGMGKSLNSICGSDDDEKNEFPHRATVYRWFSEHKSFCDNYARAKGDSADADADKLDSIAEDVLRGRVDPAAARVAADIIKWAAGKKRPKKYGDKIAIGGDVENPFQLMIKEISGFTLEPNKEE
jgi:hypothetical protein